MNAAPVGKGSERLEDQARCGGGGGVSSGWPGAKHSTTRGGAEEGEGAEIGHFPKTASMVPQCEDCKVNHGEVVFLT